MRNYFNWTLLSWVSSTFHDLKFILELSNLNWFLKVEPLKFGVIDLTLNLRELGWKQSWNFFSSFCVSPFFFNISKGFIRLTLKWEININPFRKNCYGINAYFDVKEFLDDNFVMQLFFCSFWLVLCMIFMSERIDKYYFYYYQ